MSFYWRWVVVTAAVSIAMAVPESAIEAYVARSTGSDDPTILTAASWFALYIPVALAEYWVLATRFPKLNLLHYVGLSLIPIAIVAAGLVGLTESLSVQVSPDAEISDADGLKALGFLLGIVALVPVIICLPWIALGRVARGFLLWFVSILLAGAGYVGFDVAIATARGMNWLETGGYETWPVAAWTFAATTGSILAFALISGIGVARLRPKAEAAP